MKTQRIFIALLLAIVFVLNNVSTVFAVPPQPSSFYGTVKLEGVNIPEGTIVSARINGVQYASIAALVYEGDTVYFFDVAGDDTSTPGIIEGGIEGNTIVFYIGGTIADQTGTWHMGTNVELNLTASLPPTCYALTLAHTGQGSNPVASPSNSIGCSSGQYLAGASINLSGATPVNGWQIASWTGTNNNTSTANTNTVTMPASASSASVTYTAMPPTCYALTLSHTGQGTNPVASPANSSGCSSGRYLAGASVNLSGATPISGWQIASWTGTTNNTSTANTNSLIMPANAQTSSVNYAQIEYILTISMVGSGSVTRSAPAPYHLNDVVTLTPIPAAGWSFSAWTGACTGSAGCSVTMDAAKTVIATFTQNQYTLTVTSAHGIVTRNPNKTTYTYGEVVQLTASPDEGWGFANWSGDTSGTSNPVSVTMNANKAVTANYSQGQYTLTITSAHGTVIKNPNKTTYTYGEVVQLTATPAVGWSFANWTGDVTSTSNPVSVTMNGNRAVTANYTQNTYTLTVNTVGSGSVTKNPNSSTYHYGDVVQLTAVPITGWSFSAWSGDLAGSTNPVSFVINGNNIITATFVQLPPACYALTLSHTGQGSNPVATPANSTGCSTGQYFAGATINLNNAAPTTGWEINGWAGTNNDSSTARTNIITMPAGAHAARVDYTQIQYTLTITSAHGTVAKSPLKTTYSYGEVVQLTATPDAGWSFASWSGDASGATNPFSVTMNGNKAITANYTENQYTLTTTSLHGTVTKNPNKATYTYGEIVQLTAIPDAGWNFINWSGDTNGTANPVSVTMNANKAAIANYSQGQYTLTITSSHGAIAKNPNKTTYAYGEVVQLTATPDAGWSFANWIGDATGATNPVSVTMNGNKVITAGYSQILYTLSITSLHGVVTKNPDKASYTYGEVVQLTAVPDVSWSFSNWIGGVTGSNNPVSVTMNDNKAITASYTQNTYTLTVNKVGGGTVTSNPIGINCGLDCSEIYPYNTSVTLTAITNPGSTFTGWSGGCTGTDTCTVVMNMTQSVTANWILNTPAAFDKFSPANGSINQPSSLVLSWNLSPTATSYEYCYDTTNNNACTNWINNGLSNTKVPKGLIRGITYYWHVRASNVNGVTYSNGSAGAFWSFTIGKLPSVPVLNSPASNAVTLDTTPSFTWNSAANGVNYEIQIDDSSTFTAPVIQSHIGTSGELGYTATHLFDKTYYWRVRAYNSNNEPGVWSAARKITIDTLPPLSPVHKAPANNASVRGTPAFSWLASATAVKYRFEYSSNPNCSSPIYVSPELSTVAHIPPAMGLGNFYWCVQARDLAGNWSSWSSSRTITILPLIPSAPVLISPTSCFVTNDSTPAFTWKDVTNGDTYEIQIDDTAAFTSPLIQSNHGASGQLAYTAATLPDKTYYWRVRAYNVHNEPGAWSATRRITIDTIAPLSATLKTPANMTSVRGTPTYSWLAAVTGSRYKFEYDDDSDFSSPIYTSPELTTLTHKPPAQALGTFYWHVAVKDLAGNWSGWSSPRTITILPLIPIAPTLLSPTSGFPTNDTTSTFSWNIVPDGNIYEIQIDDAATFAAPLVQSHIGMPGELTYTSTPLAAKTYYWRVRAYNVHNEVGAWSTARSIVIDITSPVSPVLKSPASRAVVRATPSYVWLASITATRYQFEYDDNSDFSSPTYTSSELTTLCHKPPTQAVGTFYWHVRARDAAGNWSSWSLSRTITILPVIPVAPVLVSPGNASAITDSTPTLYWNSVLYGNTYQIQIATNSTFTQNSQTMTSGVGVSSFTLSPLTNGKYYWRIRAINVNNELGTWSVTRYFTVSTP